MTLAQAPVKEQHHLVRMEVRSAAFFRETLCELPPLVAEPLARLVAYLAQLHPAQRDVMPPRTKQLLYERAYLAYCEARSAAEQRLHWLTDYGVALLPQLRATTPEARFLAARLARVGQMVDASLTALLTAQCALDGDIALAEDLLAA